MFQTMYRINPYPSLQEMNIDCGKSNNNDLWSVHVVPLLYFMAARARTALVTAWSRPTLVTSIELNEMKYIL